MLIYRIEHPNDGIGPYQTFRPELEDDLVAQGMIYALNDAHDSDRWRPGPFRDEILSTLDMWDFSDYKFGFASRARMRVWFKAWGQELARAGFKVAVYNTDTVIQGERQDIFPKDAEFVRYECIKFS